MKHTLCLIIIIYYRISVYDDYGFESQTTAPRKFRKGQNQEEEDFFNRPKEPVFKEESYPCDKKTNLYILDQQMFIQGKDYGEEVPTNCSKPYFVKRIPKSNLLFVSVNALFGSCVRKMSVEPQLITYNNAFPCNKLNMNFWPRRRLDECFTEHPDVS